MQQHLIKENKHKRNKLLHSNRHTSKLYQEHVQNQIKQQQINIILQKGKHQYYVQQNLNLSIRYFQEYLQLSPNSNQALYLCGVCYLNQDNSNQAISKLEKISYSYQNKQNSLLLLSMAYNKINKIQLSLQTINTCLNNFPKFQEGYYFRGKVLLRMQKFYQAIRDFQCCLQINPNSIAAKIGLGDCYRSQGHFQKAINSYNQSRKSSLHQPCYRQDLILKSAICYFYLQKYKTVVQFLDDPTTNFTLINKGSQYYFYLGESYLNLQRKQKEKGILNLQYCIKMQTNKSLIIKSVRKLLQLFIEDYQFYQAMNIIKLAENYKIQCKDWVQVVQGFMLIIKAKYDEGYQKIKNVYSLLKGSFRDNVKIKTQSKGLSNIIYSPLQINKVTSVKKKSIIPINQKLLQASYRKACSLKHVRRPSLTEDARKQPIFNKNTIAHKNIMSNTKYKIKLSNNFNFPHKKAQSYQLNAKIIDKNIIFSQKQEIFLMPIVLKFKAYCQFFKNNYLRSLDTYDQYQSYMRDVFGKQNIQDVQYEKSLCEALLMSESQMYEDGLQKYSKCIDVYYRHHKCVPIEPILYKAIHIMQTALNLNDSSSFQQRKYHMQKYFQTSLNLLQNYRSILKNSHLAFYLQGLIHLVLQRYQSAQFCLEKTLKLAQECSWKYLYVKGVIQIYNQKFYDAIKQFTAGLILQQKADLYLCRSISFLLEGFQRKKAKNSLQTNQLKKSVNLNQTYKQQSNQQQSLNRQSQASSQIFIQNSFQDLQKFIQLQTEQEKISLWVTKLLFYNNAFEQASKALQKISQKGEDVKQIKQCIQIYQGNFQSGGALGQLIIRAFQGSILSQQQQKDLQKSQKKIQRELSALGIQLQYSKWLVTLHLYVKKKYALLLNFLQKQIFKTASKNQLDQLELRYNIAIVYLLLGQSSKAINVISGLNKFCSSQQLNSRIQKMSNLDFADDQYIPDLQQQISSHSLRLSNYLVSHPAYLQKEHKVRIYLKLSIPFPEFPKPNIKIQIGQVFLRKQLNLNMVQKKLQAPWINKKNNQIIQFTQQIIQANTQFLKQQSVKQGNQSVKLSGYTNNNQISQIGYGLTSSDYQMQQNQYK